MSRSTLAVAFVALLLAIGIGLIVGPYLPGGSKVTGLLSHIKLESAPRPLEQIAAEMSRAEKGLDGLYVQARSSAAYTVVNRVEQLLEIVNNGYEELGRIEHLPKEAEVAAQMTILRSHFLASKVIPAYASVFESLVDQVIEIRPQSNDAAEAHILRFCHKHELHKPMQPKTLKDVKEMAIVFQQPWHGIMAYSVIASELWSNGQPKSAERVLTEGIAAFKGQRGQTHLVHQLVEQGHRPPPKPSITQKQFKALMRAAETVAASRSTSSPCTKFR